MNQQQNLKEELVRKQIDKICQKNPDLVPIYYILNSKDSTTVPEEWPVVFFSRQLNFSQLIQKLKQKFKSYPHIYVFGKDNIEEKRIAEMSLKQKRKNKGKGEHIENRQKLITLDQELLKMKVGEAHQRYKDKNNLLVIIFSTQVFQKSRPKRQLKQYFFIVFCIVCAGFYLFLWSNNKAQPSEVDLAGNTTNVEM